MPIVMQEKGLPGRIRLATEGTSEKSLSKYAATQVGAPPRATCRFEVGTADGRPAPTVAHKLVTLPRTCPLGPTRTSAACCGATSSLITTAADGQQQPSFCSCSSNCSIGPQCTVPHCDSNNAGPRPSWPCWAVIQCHSCHSVTE